MFGSESEMIIDSLLREGQAPASTIIINAGLKLSELPGCGMYLLFIINLSFNNKILV